MQNTVDIQIGKRIANHRQLGSISLQSAAARCGLSTEDYLAGEQGQRRFQAGELFELATYFNVRFSTFFRGLTLR